MVGAGAGAILDDLAVFWDGVAVIRPHCGWPALGRRDRRRRAVAATIAAAWVEDLRMRRIACNLGIEAAES
jgi:hypothetical protein